MNWHLELEWFKFKTTKYKDGSRPWEFTTLKVIAYRGKEHFEYWDFGVLRSKVDECGRSFPRFQFKVKHSIDVPEGYFD